MKDRYERFDFSMLARVCITCSNCSCQIEGNPTKLSNEIKCPGCGQDLTSQETGAGQVLRRIVESFAIWNPSAPTKQPTPTEVLNRTPRGGEVSLVFRVAD